MAEPPPTIRPAWPDRLVYDDGHGRTMAFSCLAMNAPPQVLVPVQARWAAWAPAWARTSRAAIVGRLQEAGCVVVHEDADGYRFDTPDGMLQVAVQRVHDERTGHWETAQVRTAATQELLASTTSHGGAHSFAFAQPGTIDVLWNDRAARPRHLRLAAATRSFRLLPSQVDEPLAALPERLGEAAPAPVQHAAPVPLRSLLGDGAGAALLAAAGLWMALDAETLLQRWFGAFAGLFFGACALLVLRDLRRRASGAGRAGRR